MASVLLVDDEESFRIHLGKALELEGYSVFRACDGSEALRLLERFVPDVLVVDWQLPGALTGLDVIRKVREYSHAVAVLVMTGYAADEVEAAAGESFALIEKPFPVEEFLDRVNASL